MQKNSWDVKLWLWDDVRMKIWEGDRDFMFSRYIQGTKEKLGENILKGNVKQ